MRYRRGHGVLSARPLDKEQQEATGMGQRPMMRLRVNLTAKAEAFRAIERHECADTFLVVSNPLKAGARTPLHRGTGGDAFSRTWLA